ncbi:hypothetical protein [Actinacidiphila guanduensis]|uniref:Uncharacterized protein n=1 Tax=Actinacidiphila guanduensis TaxID=310781 RepID=A0A1H0DR64_9ACTN|nr:hypothetical protein [Actinacidiphila guanduensis]SDN72539.1 hypothetical protein SAMN05216259_105316 [Actinacidiphila guanduensis]
MAKNRNQNRQQHDQQHDQRERRSERAGEPQERAAGTMTEERVMPSATEVTRKQQKRFGHN